MQQSDSSFPLVDGSVSKAHVGDTEREIRARHAPPTPLELAVRAHLYTLNRHERRAWAMKQCRAVGAQRLAAHTVKPA